MANTRMKDYFDLFVILKNTQLDRMILTQAMSATLSRRGTAEPQKIPLGLTDQFAVDTQKNTQWRAFIARNNLKAESLSDTLAYLRENLAFLFEKEPV
jgi:hypothetical protein